MYTNCRGPTPIGNVGSPTPVEAVCQNRWLISGEIEYFLGAIVRHFHSVAAVRCPLDHSQVTKSSAATIQVSGASAAPISSSYAGLRWLC